MDDDGSDAVRLSGIRSREVVPQPAMDDGYELLVARIRRGTTIDGAIVALCPAEDGTVTADVCIDGPPVP